MDDEMHYDWEDDSRKSFDVAIGSLRDRLEKSKVVIGDCTLYNEDCEFVLPALPTTLAVVSDPPYGMDWNTDHSRFKPGPNGHGKSKAVDWNAPIHGDDAPFDPAPLLRFPEVIIWGANHYAARLPVGTTLVWLKRNDNGFGSFLSDAEVAWMKGGHGVYCKRDTSLMAEANNRFHPTQKPVPLMQWCIEKISTGVAILDPYMGSGTTGVAAIKLGRKFIGIERDKKHFATACRRIEEAYKQPDMFISAPAVKAVQTGFAFEDDNLGA